MIGAALGFFMSPIGRKVGIAALAGIALWFMYGYVTQKAWNDGYLEGKTDVIEEMEEKLQKELESAREEIRKEKEEIEAEREAAAADKKEAQRLRASIRRDVRNEVNKIKVDTKDEIEAIDDVPDSELSFYIRSQLAEQRELDERFRGTSTDPYIAFSSESTSGPTINR